MSKTPPLTYGLLSKENTSIILIEVPNCEIIDGKKKKMLRKFVCSVSASFSQQLLYIDVVGSFRQGSQKCLTPGTHILV